MCCFRHVIWRQTFWTYRNHSHNYHIFSSLKMNALHETMTPECPSTLSLLTPPCLLRKKFKFDELVVSGAAFPSSLFLLPADFKTQSTSNDENVPQFRLKPRFPNISRRSSPSSICLSNEFAATTLKKASSSSLDQRPMLKRRRSSLCGSSVQDILFTPQQNNRRSSLCESSVEDILLTPVQKRRRSSLCGSSGQDILLTPPQKKRRRSSLCGSSVRAARCA
jgi:hypothetical protein